MGPCFWPEVWVFGILFPGTFVTCFSYFTDAITQDARAPILIIEVYVRPVKILHYCQQSHCSVYKENPIINSLPFLALPKYVSSQLVVSLHSCLYLVSSVLIPPCGLSQQFSRPSLPFLLSLFPLKASAWAPILIIEV